MRQAQSALISPHEVEKAEKRGNLCLKSNGKGERGSQRSGEAKDAKKNHNPASSSGPRL